MNSSETKLKHLEFIQAVITRMNNCSFLLKGWSVTLVSALFALSTIGTDLRFILFAYFPAFAFWILDGFFLDQERRYRKLYELVAKDDTTVPELEMNTTNIKSIKGSWLSTLFTSTILIFHGVITGTILIVMTAIILTN